MTKKKPAGKALKATQSLTKSKTAPAKAAPPKLIPWDAARYIKNKKEAILYINGALEDFHREPNDDPAFVADAFGVAARAVGMSKIAKKTGLSREALYRALSYDGNPEFATILKVANALGVTFKVK